MIKRSILLLGVFALLAQPAFAAEVKGKFEINGNSVTLSEATSFSTNNNKIMLVLSDKPLPEGYRQPGKGVQGVSLLIDGNNIEKVALYQGESYFTTGFTRSIEFTPGEQSKESISGKISLKKDGPPVFSNASLDALDVQFATAIQVTK